MKKNAILLFLMLVTLQNFAQKFCYTNYGNNEGLIQSQVIKIHEDKDGFLWLATLGGLSKFDGERFINFTERDGLLNNKVLCFYEDTNSVLYLGSKGGINYIVNQTIYQIKLNNPQEKVKQIILNSQHKISFITSENRYGVINSLNEIDTIFKINIKNKVLDYCVSLNSEYIITQNALFKYDFEKNKPSDTIINKEDANFYKVKSDKKNLYLSSYGYGLYQYNIENKKTKFYNNLKGLLSNNIRDIYLDDTSIWIATNKGINKITSDSIYTYNSANGLAYNVINCIIKDKYGTFWFGTSGNGLLKFQGNNIKVYDKLPNNSPFYSLSFHEIDHKDIKIGTYRNGIIGIHNNKKMSISKVNSENTQPSFWCTEKYLNQYYFGSDNGVYKYENGVYKKAFIIDDKILSMYNDGKYLWVGTRTELIKIDKDSIKERHSFENIRSICKSKNTNHLFIGTSKGVYNFTTKRYINLDSISKKTFNNLEINTITFDDFNNMWVGAKTGLFKLDNEILQPQTFSNKASANNIEFLICDLDKNLWIGTLDGVYVLLKEQLETSSCNYLNTIHFGKSDGFENLEANQNAAFLERNGNLWLGMSDNLYQIKPDYLKDKISNISPYLKIQHVDSYLKPIFNIKNRKLVFKENKNYITFNYKTTDLNSPEDIYYKFYLKGSDENWLPVTKQTHATYSNLASGDYIFHVLSINKFGIESNEILIPLTITPMFYNTWWFKISCFIFLLLTTYILIRNYRKNILKKEETKNLKNKSYMRDLEQKSLNASMNRHFIFNALNSIQYYIIQNDRLSANKYLTRFAKLIRLNLDSSQANVVDLETELERLHLYLELEKMRFKTFDFEINIDEHITLSDIKMPPMILQPYVENSIIHGLQGGKINNGLIVIDIEKHNKYIAIKLKDNGIGIEKSINKKSKQKGDHTSYGTEITKNRIDLFSSMEKESIELIGPKDILDEQNKILGTYIELKLYFEEIL